MSQDYYNHYQGTGTDMNSESESISNTDDILYKEGYLDGFREGNRQMFHKYFDVAFRYINIIFRTEKFFVKKLWKCIDGFKEEHDDDVKNAFVWYWLRKDADENKYIFSEEIENYINSNQDEKYIPVFDTYKIWKENENKKPKTFWNKIINFFQK